jgi:hypothetical protein
MNEEVAKTVNAVFGRVDIQHTILLKETSLSAGLSAHCLSTLAAMFIF